MSQEPREWDSGAYHQLSEPQLLWGKRVLSWLSLRGKNCRSASTIRPLSSTIAGSTCGPAGRNERRALGKAARNRSLCAVGAGAFAGFLELIEKTGGARA